MMKRKRSLLCILLAALLALTPTAALALEVGDETAADIGTTVPIFTEPPVELPAPVPVETPEPEPTEAPTAIPDKTPEAPAPTADPEETPEPTMEPTPEVQPLLAVLSGRPLYGVRRTPMELTVTVSGGVAPYTVAVNGAPTDAAAAGDVAVVVTPERSGRYGLSILVTDAEGRVATLNAEIPVSGTATERPADWERTVRDARLTGDWAEDLIAVALTQLGYTESASNFIIAGDGSVQGYTRYGHWAGLPYGEWCAMFVAFCLEYAGIPEDGFPRDVNCDRWRLSLGDLYVDAAAGYAPRPGDLVFFHRDREGGSVDPDFPNHVGIVTRVTDSTLYTIEGNRDKAVKECEYSRDAPGIVAYADLGRAERIARELPEEDATDETEAEPLAARPPLYTVPDITNLREAPSTESAILAKLAPAGTALEAVRQLEVDGETWYEVAWKDLTGYLRGDVVKVSQPPEEALLEIHPAAFTVDVEGMEGVVFTVTPADPTAVPAGATLRAWLAQGDAASVSVVFQDADGNIVTPDTALRLEVAAAAE